MSASTTDSAARLAEHIKKVVDSAPAATPDQLARIGAVLKAGAA